MPSRTQSSSTQSRASTSIINFDHVHSEDQNDKKKTRTRCLDGCINCRLRRKKCPGPASAADLSCVTCLSHNVICRGYPGRMPEWASRRETDQDGRIKQWINTPRTQGYSGLQDFNMYQDPILPEDLNEFSTDAQLASRSGNGRRSSVMTSQRSEYAGLPGPPSTRRGSISSSQKDRTVSSQESGSSSSGRGSRRKSTADKIGNGLMGVFYAGPKAKEGAARAIEVASASAASRDPGSSSKRSGSSTRAAPSEARSRVQGSSRPPVVDYTSAPVPSSRTHSHSATTNTLAPAVQGFATSRQSSCYDPNAYSLGHQPAGSRGSSPGYQSSQSSSSGSRHSPHPSMYSSTSSPPSSALQLPTYSIPATDVNAQYLGQYAQYPSDEVLGQTMAPSAYGPAFASSLSSYSAANGYYVGGSAVMGIGQGADASQMAYMQGSHLGYMDGSNFPSW